MRNLQLRLIAVKSQCMNTAQVGANDRSSRHRALPTDSQEAAKCHGLVEVRGVSEFAKLG